jgi:hypothetical protein
LVHRKQKRALLACKKSYTYDIHALERRKEGSNNEHKHKTPYVTYQRALSPEDVFYI